MKKGITAMLAFVLLAASALLTANALTLYELDGYTYTIINNYSVSIYGWDGRSSNFIVPNQILGRYVTQIDNYALEDSAITSVDFTQAAHLETIGTYAFKGCEQLEGEVVIPESVTIMKDSSFQGCTNVENVVINGQLKYIARQAFYSCSALKTVTLPDTVKTIYPFAFADCALLARIDIPVSVESIDSTAFQNDPNLTLGVWYGSYGYEYAKAQNIPYVLLDNALLGDANGDESVNINDVTAVQRYLAELDTLEGIYLHAADANQDGTVDIADATAIQMYLAEYEMDYPIGKNMTQ